MLILTAVRCVMHKKNKKKTSNRIRQDGAPQMSTRWNIQFIQPSVWLAELRLDTRIPQVGINPSSIWTGGKMGSQQYLVK